MARTWETTEDDVITVLTRHYGWERKLSDEEIARALEVCNNEDDAITAAAADADDDDPTEIAHAMMLDAMLRAGVVGPAVRKAVEAGAV